MEAIFTELEPTFVDFSSAERETTKIDYARQINRRAKEALFITSAIILIVLMISHHGIGITNFKCIPTEPIDSYGDFVDHYCINHLYLLVNGKKVFSYSSTYGIRPLLIGFNGVFAFFFLILEEFGNYDRADHLGPVQLLKMVKRNKNVPQELKDGLRRSVEKDTKMSSKMSLVQITMLSFLISMTTDGLVLSPQGMVDRWPLMHSPFAYCDVDMGQDTLALPEVKDNIPDFFSVKCLLMSNTVFFYGRILIVMNLMVIGAIEFFSIISDFF